MRISDWSSDVCSSGLVALGEALRFHHQRHFAGLGAQFDDVTRLYAGGCDVGLLAVQVDVAVANDLAGRKDRRSEQNGRASCRGRECQYGEFSGIAVY